MSPVGDLHLLRRFSSTTEVLLQLLDAGYPFQKAVLVLADCEKERSYRARLLRMGADMDQGGSFHVTLRHILPAALTLTIWNVSLLPDMRAVLKNMGDYVSQKEKALRTLFKALLYPFFLLVGLAMVMLLFVFQVVPAMGALVEGAPPSFILSAVMGLQLWVLAHMGGVVMGVCGGLLVFLGWLWTRGWSRFLGLWFRPRAADVAWIMGLLLLNGLSMEAALNALVASSPGKEIRWVHAEVMQSGQFSAGFIRFFRVTGIQVQLLTVSEKSGTLSARLITVGQALLVEDMQRLSRYIGLVQPVLLLLVGVLVWLLMQVVMAPLSSMIQML